MNNIPVTLLNGLMTTSGLEPNFFGVDFCCEVRLGLVTCGGRLIVGSIQETVLG